MKYFCSALVVAAAGLLSAAAFEGRAKVVRATSVAAHAPVIVELFTSEGCSSCPPADALLSKLETEQSVQEAEVIALEEHVDYWNNGGWMDPFSSSIWSDRQVAYARVLKNENPYTPQMVVDGQDEFVGGQLGRAVAAIQRASGREKSDIVISSVLLGSPGKLRVSVKVGRISASSASDTPEVFLAMTEMGLHSSVMRGENAGKELYHAAVVRMMRKIGEASASGELSFSGETDVKLDPRWKRESVRAVVFLQGKKSKHIVGAASATVPR
ncbi:MAG: hypothetical protein NVS9B4_14570 [Candidatus Acidiferrum sp.]